MFNTGSTLNCNASYGPLRWDSNLTGQNNYNFQICIQNVEKRLTPKMDVTVKQQPFILSSDADGLSTNAFKNVGWNYCTPITLLQRIPGF